MLVKGKWYKMCLGFLALQFLTLQAYASGLQVAPISLQLSPHQRAGQLWLKNTSVNSKMLGAQIRVFEWTQKNGHDLLKPTHDLIISPPMLSIAQNEPQLVRVIQSQFSKLSKEKAYRLIVDELPPSSPSNHSSDTPNKATGGLKFIMHYSLPVFIGQSQWTEQVSLKKIHWHAKFVKHSGYEQIHLEGQNDNQAHIRVSNLRLFNKQTKAFQKTGLVGYILAGKKMIWNFNLKNLKSTTNLTIKVQVNGQNVVIPVQ